MQFIELKELLYIKHSLCPRLQTHSPKKKSLFPFPLKYMLSRRDLSRSKGISPVLLSAQSSRQHIAVTPLTSHIMRCVNSAHAPVVSFCTRCGVDNWAVVSLRQDGYCTMCTFQIQFEKVNILGHINSAISLNTLWK